MPQNENITVTFTSSKEGESKMKPGEKYIIEIDRVVKGPRDIAFVKGFNALVFDQYGLDHLERCDDKKARKTVDDAVDAAYKRGWNECAEKNIKDAAYQNGLDTAWNLARSLISDYGIAELKAIFDRWGKAVDARDIIMENTASETIGKIRKWAEDKAVIHVGDEVKFKRSDTTFVVTKVDGQFISGFSADGSQYGDKFSINWEKTGRHFDLTKLFQFMGRKDDGREL